MGLNLAVPGLAVRRAATLGLASLGLASLGLSSLALAHDTTGGFADLTDRLSPAVVNIATSQTLAEPGGGFTDLPPGSPFADFFRDYRERYGFPGRRAPRRLRSLGSGFIIDPAGIIVTNRHVIDGADEIQITLAGGETLRAQVMGSDAKTDLAVLQVEPDAPLPFLGFGDSDAARVGDWVLAIGNSLGLGGTVNAGIISAINRDINAGPYDAFIQTDLTINQGGSGGPLFNLQGEVIGVNTAIASPTGGSVGISFAVPSSLAAGVVAQLREFGATRRGWLGVRIQTVSEDIAEGLEMAAPRGALVASVQPLSPAEDAGIAVGDVILMFNGHPVEQMRDLPRLVADTPVDETVDVRILRSGREQTITVQIRQLDEDQAAAEDDPAPEGAAPSPRTPAPDAEEVLGLTLMPLTDRLRERFNLPAAASGVLVRRVDHLAAAADKGIRPGDLIIAVGQDGVTQPAQVLAHMAQARRAGRKAILLQIATGNTTRFVALSLPDSNGP